MKVLIIGGFLGSGKTTVIGKILTGMAANNTSAALIENEIGEVGIDDVFFGGNGISVTPLFGGCVCCQISGSLLDAAGKIQDEINPDWLIVEMTGLALMNNIRDVFLKYGRGGVSVHMISVLDISRWEILNKTVPQLIRHQLEGANVILMNKTDVSAITKEITASIKSINPQAESLAVSAIIENTGFWQRLKGFYIIWGAKTMTNNRQASATHRHDRHTHRPGCGRAYHEHGHSESENIANQAFRLSRRSDISLATRITARELETSISERLMEAAQRIAVDGAVLGHIKAIVQLAECAVGLSITRIGVVDKTYIGRWKAEETIHGYSLTVNILSVANRDVDLDDIMDRRF